MLAVQNESFNGMWQAGARPAQSSSERQQHGAATATHFGDPEGEAGIRAGTADSHSGYVPCLPPPNAHVLGWDALRCDLWEWDER